MRGLVPQANEENPIVGRKANGAPRAVHLQLPRAAKRGDGERNKHQANNNGNTDQPVRGITRPRTKRHIQPAERQHGKNRADGFVE